MFGFLNKDKKGLQNQASLTDEAESTGQPAWANTETTAYTNSVAYEETTTTSNYEGGNNDNDDVAENGQATLVAAGEEEEEQPFEHSWEAGDHVIRWEMLPIAYPIQVHGIILEANDRFVKMADFGLTALPVEDEGDKKDDEESKKEDAIKAFFKRKMNSKKERLNIRVLTTNKELSPWRKVNYNGNFLGLGGGEEGEGNGKKKWLGKLFGKKNQQDEVSAVESKEEDAEEEEKKEASSETAPAVVPATSSLPEETPDKADSPEESQSNQAATTATETTTTTTTTIEKEETTSSSASSSPETPGGESSSSSATAAAPPAAAAASDSVLPAAPPSDEKTNTEAGISSAEEQPEAAAPKNDTTSTTTTAEADGNDDEDSMGFPVGQEQEGAAATEESSKTDPAGVNGEQQQQVVDTVDTKDQATRNSGNEDGALLRGWHRSEDDEILDILEQAKQAEEEAKNQTTADGKEPKQSNRKRWIRRQAEFMRDSVREQNELNNPFSSFRSWRASSSTSSDNNNNNTDGSKLSQLWPRRASQTEDDNETEATDDEEESTTTTKFMNPAMAKLMKKKSPKKKSPRKRLSSGDVAANSPNTKPKIPDSVYKLPKDDPTKLVLARVHFLLHHGEAVLPPYNPFSSNSETIAVWCKTGHFSTIQADVFLHSTAIGNGKSATAVALGVAATSGLAAAGVAGIGVAAVIAPWWYLKHSKDKCGDAETALNDAFWAQASPEVFVECIEKWSTITKSTTTNKEDLKENDNNDEQKKEDAAKEKVAAAN